MATLKVEFKALTEPVSLTATSDGKVSSNVVPAGSSATFEPKESLKLSYSWNRSPNRPVDDKRKNDHASGRTT